MNIITLPEKQLQKIDLSLSSRGAVLESVKIYLHKQFVLHPQSTLTLLDALKQLRVDGQAGVGDWEVPV